MKNEKVTPQSLNAEQSTLGACLIDRDAVAVAGEMLKADDFYLQNHRTIFTALLGLFERGEPVDLITATEELRRLGKLDDIGGTSYLTALIESCPSSVAVDTYAKIVADKSALRHLLKASEEITRDVFHSDKTAQEQIDGAGSRFFALGHKQSGGGFEQAAPHVNAVVERIKHRREHHSPIIGLPTGFYEIDELTGGLRSGEMTVLAARPGMGKSALAMQIALNVATGGQAFRVGKWGARPVAFVSLEMSRDMLLSRAVAQVSGVDAQEMERGYIDEEQLSRIKYAAHVIAESKLYIDDARGSNTFQLLARTRKLAVEAGSVGLIVVDYLQLVKSAGKSENRVQELSEVGKALRTMALQFDCPVLVLAQLSRSVEQREDKRPVKSDLRDSGTIEEDADNVALIYREAYYKKNDNPLAEIIYDKQRNGPVGTARLNFFSQSVVFTNLAKD